MKNHVEKVREWLEENAFKCFLSQRGHIIGISGYLDEFNGSFLVSFDSIEVVQRF